MKSTYLIIAHGSREQQANQDFQNFLKAFRKVFPKRKVEGAFLELAKPSIPEALEKIIKAGAGEIFILPLMLFSGRHVKEDIPAFIEQAKARHPEVDFHYSGPLSDHPMIFKLLNEKSKRLKGKRGRRA